MVENASDASSQRFDELRRSHPLMVTLVTDSQ
jgi:hypothetical protein